MAQKPAKRTNRAVARKPKRNASAVKGGVGKPKRKTSAVKGGVRKHKHKASTIKGGVRKPKPKPYPVEAVAQGPERNNVDIVKPVVIEPRRTVETSDALIFPSGRPIRKR